MRTMERIVAVVDDDISVRESLEGLIRSARIEVSVFVSAEEFLNSDRLREADCLVLDVHLPGMTGIAASPPPLGPQSQSAGHFHHGPFKRRPCKVGRSVGMDCCLLDEAIQRGRIARRRPRGFEMEIEDPTD